MFVQGDESDPVGVLLMENFTVNPDPMQVFRRKEMSCNASRLFVVETFHAQELQSFTVTFRAEEVNKLLV